MYLLAQNPESRRYSVALQRKRPFVSIKPSFFSRYKILRKNSSSTPEISSYSSDSNLLLMSRTKADTNLKTKSESDSDIFLSCASNSTNLGTKSQKSEDKLDGMAQTKDGSVLYNIQWNFPTLRKQLWSRIAQFALGSTTQEERPVSNPPSIRKCRM
jgi:hypothetical protein